MQCFSCVNCSWNSKMHPDSSSSNIHVLSGHSLKCRFHILEYWFSSSPSLIHRFMMASFLGQYSIIKSSVSATIAHWSLYLSSIHFLNLLFLSDCVMHCLVSFFMKSIFDCTLSQGILNLRWISSGLLSSLGVLCCVLNVSSISECWLSLVLLLVLSSELSVLNMSLAVSLASWLYFCLDFQLSACSLARFLRSGESKGDLTLLQMCWLTNLDMSSWSTRLLQRPVFWFDPCIVRIDSPLSAMASLLVESNGCFSFLSSWILLKFVLNFIGLLGLNSCCLSFCSACPLVEVAYLNHSEDGGRYHLHRPGSWLRFSWILINCRSDCQFFFLISLSVL